MQLVEQSLNHIFQGSAARYVEKTGKQWAPVLEYSILGLIAILCFMIRLFAVIRFESVIHEFDPYFNYRTTHYLVREGFYEFWNWFDDGSWYPLGRVIGQTLYPGLMTTSYIMHTFLTFTGFPLDVRNVCVFLAPIFAGLTSIAAYLFTKECTDYEGAGLFAALFIGISSSYMSRSIAGSYDNEAVAIFALIFTFYVFVKAAKTGSILWSVFAVVAYGYMVASWGGYVFITNTICCFVIFNFILGRVNEKHFVSFNVFYVLGTIFCLNIPFVGFAAVQSSEHMSSHGVFLAINSMFFAKFLREKLPVRWQKFIMWAFVGGAVFFFLAIFIYMTIKGKTAFSGRSMTLLDPTYASKYIPIIASVSEHQPTSWANFFMDLYILPVFMPLGFYVCFYKPTDGKLFLGIYGILSVYFAGVMVRLLLVLAPAAACLAGVGVSYMMYYFTGSLRLGTVMDKAKKHRMSPIAGLVGIGIVFFWLLRYVTHSTFMASFVYSNPSIVMSSKARDGSRIIQDDFREAYYWLRHNTHPKTNIASWWDYGYQIAVMSNRTVLTDNNTWNNTHIATMGLLMGSTEEDAVEIMTRLDADYFLLIFGGVVAFPSDDINKFLWPIRIANGVYPDQIRESDFISSKGYRIDDGATERFRNSILYKMSLYRVHEVTDGKDFARNQKIGYPDITFNHFTEAFTSENWLVRIYKMNKPNNRGPKAIARWKKDKKQKD